MGGLGNQLFQIFTTIAYSIECNQPCLFLNTLQLNGCTPRKSYWHTFLKALYPFTRNYLKPVPIYKELCYNYNKLPDQNDVMLYGYFQSYKYFEKYIKQIKKICKIDYQKAVVNTKINTENTISMHFRLGDYKLLPDHYKILEYTYYKNSLDHIQSKLKSNKNTKILYFCELADLPDVLKIIEQLDNEFKYQFIQIPNFEDWEQMLIMSCCTHNIIANSTFSWWGAYLNNNPDKIVCYPDEWFGSELEHDVSDLCPPDWICIKTT